MRHIILTNMIRGKMLMSCGRVVVRAVISAGFIEQSLPLPADCRRPASNCAHVSTTSGHQPEAAPTRNVHASCCGFPKDMVNGPSVVRDHGIFGDDACFIARFRNTHVVGVADGVGGWRRYGIDPSEFSSRLMKICFDLVQLGEFEPCRPDRLLAHAYAAMSAPPRPIGSSTACILVVDQDTLYSANLGDSGFLLLRRGQVVYRSREQTHYFNAPFQLSLLPDNARAAGFLGDPPEKAELNSIDLQSGDVVVLATDGLWDNVSENLIVEQLSNIQHGDIQAACNTLALTARRLAFDSRHLSPFAMKASQHGISAVGGKPDDITLVLLLIA
uniref:Protein phosphatase n=2 Tax=Parascaris univalens TaxID=6257 RepID=A0A915AR15_PARUN